MSKHLNQKSEAPDSLRGGIQTIANQLGLRVGFPSNEDRAELPFVVRYYTLSRELLGDRRFERVYHSAINAAGHIAGRLGYLAEPVRDHRGVLVGREFRFATKLKAVRFRLFVDAALAGHLLPSTGVAQ